MVNAGSEDPARKLQEQIGGAHGVLVTAVSPIAFKQACQTQSYLRIGQRYLRMTQNPL